MARKPTTKKPPVSPPEVAPEPVTEVVAEPAPDGGEPQTAKAFEGDLVRVATIGKKPRRRAGRAFGPEPVDIPVAQLGDGELAALLDDPLLTVEAIKA